MLFKIMVHYHLLNMWGTPHLGKEVYYAFHREPLSSFSYKKQLKESAYVAKLKQEMEKRTFPTGRGEDAYLIADDVITECEGFSISDFDEIRAYVQMLLKYKMMTIHEDADEDIIDGIPVYNPYREYQIKL